MEQSVGPIYVPVCCDATREDGLVMIEFGPMHAGDVGALVDLIAERRDYVRDRLIDFMAAAIIGGVSPI